jgi:hypothetical protein
MDDNYDWLEGADDEEIRWRCAMKAQWEEMMREFRLHPIERPDEGPQNAYGEEEEQNATLARLVEETSAAPEEGPPAIPVVAEDVTEDRATSNNVDNSNVSS